jgi:hypothetical protein
MNGNESWVPATAVRLHLYHIINNFAVHHDIATTKQAGRFSRNTKTSLGRPVSWVFSPLSIFSLSTE